MKHVNKVGPAIIVDDIPEKLESDSIADVAAKRMVIDTRDSRSFADGHVPGTINIPTKFLAAWAGWLVNYNEPVYFLTANEDLNEAIRVIRKIGIEQLAGWFDDQEASLAGLFSQSYASSRPQEIADRINNDDVILIDVRGDAEWHESHIEKAKRCFLADLPEKLAEYQGECTLVFHCRSGARSAIAVSLAQAAGIENVINMTGGISAWEAAGLETRTSTTSCCGPTHESSEGELACQSQAIYWNAKCPAVSAS